MNSVYCYSANINQGQISDEESIEQHLSPPIILIGTHRNSFPNSTKNLMVENKMTEIRTMIATKPYAKHVIGTYFALDTNRLDAVDFEPST